MSFKRSRVSRSDSFDQPNYSSSSSTQNPNKFFKPSFAVTSPVKASVGIGTKPYQQSLGYFLKECYFCKTSIRSDINIFMYSCGWCGYELNLNSCNRNTRVIGSKYGKTMRRGVLSFLCIDETRFIQINKLRCSPYFRSKNSWGFFKQQTKLLCRNCSSYIGIAHIENTNNNTSATSLARKNINVKSDATTNWDGLSACTTNYDIKICALKPSVAFL